MFWAENEAGMRDVMSKLKELSEDYPERDSYKVCDFMKGIVQGCSTLKEEIYFRRSRRSR